MAFSFTCDDATFLKPNEIKQERVENLLLKESHELANLENTASCKNTNSTYIIRQINLDSETDRMTDKSSEPNENSDIIPLTVENIPKIDFENVKQENLNTNYTEIKLENFYGSKDVYNYNNTLSGFENNLTNSYKIKEETNLGTDFEVGNETSTTQLYVLKQESTDLGVDYVGIHDNGSDKKNIAETHPITEASKQNCNVCTETLQDCNHTTQECNHTTQECNTSTETLQNCTTQESKHKCNVCFKEFKWKSTLHGHKKIHTGIKPFECPTCNMRFLRRSVLNLHLKQHEGLVLFKCNSCKASFVTKGELEEHFYCKHSTNKPFKCRDCDKSFTTNKYLIRHANIHKDEEPFKCGLCSFMHNDAYNLKRHMKVHDKITHVCEYCGRECSNSGSLFRHIKVCKRKNETDRMTEKSSEPNENTDIIPLTVVNIPKIDFDEVKQENLNTNYTEIKLENFYGSKEVYNNTLSDFENNLTNSYKIKEETNLGTDFEIGKETSTTQLYVLKQECTDLGVDYIGIDDNGSDKNNITETHPTTEASKQTCNVCTETLQDCNHTTLDSNQQCNTFTETLQNCTPQESKHKCNVCFKEFKWKSTLHGHKKIHTGIKPFECPTCNMRFLRRSVLNLHLKRHEGLKLFKCNSCKASFITKGELEEHFYCKHSTNKPFTCIHCDKSFATNKYLIRHANIHKDEKPFKCGLCSFRYNDAYNLKRHMKVHDKITHDVCEYCGRECGNSGSLFRHVKVCKRKNGF
ncbi:uncharacterized protein [Epargyreus clarus]|uniref:uncharacterized protein n=1 Tax=Epargyreus clarus TaxID=520877 RepID=UPI003C2DD3EF